MEQWKKSIYTDLAVEERESFPGDGGEIPGVSLREWEKEEAGIHLTEVVIKTEEGAGNMGKPMGTYVTLEALALAERDEDFHREVSEELAARISGLLALHQIGTGGNGRAPSILAVGLGNENATPDALGPLVLKHLQIDPASHRRLWGGICGRKKISGPQLDHSRRHGPDGDGDGGDPEGSDRGDETGCSFGGGRPGGPKRPAAGRYDPAFRCGDPSGLRRGKPQEQPGTGRLWECR